ncbi:NUDIX hydrolase [Streptomyces sp. NPDC005438]|uniref:NUDIX hydrolase n=1 Tax=Streptomyces sp. NPDC005438 TaxID=3156880 RepID=UPI0033BCF6E0
MSDPHPLDEPVRAAGCVLWRPGEEAVEFAVIHRPKYDDWSLPKGKLHPEESFPLAAVREVREETGMDCALGLQLPTVRYVSAGRPKEVHYWTAEATQGAFRPGPEVDEMEWLPAGEARERLTHELDRGTLDAAVEALLT